MVQGRCVKMHFNVIPYQLHIIAQTYQSETIITYSPFYAISLHWFQVPKILLYDHTAKGSLCGILRHFPWSAPA